MKVVTSAHGEVYVDFFVQKKKGGNHTTYCKVGWKDTVPYVDYARCHPTKDKYNKVTGKAKALDRVLQSFFPGKENRHTRLEIWMQVLTKLQTEDKKFLSGEPVIICGKKKS